MSCKTSVLASPTAVADAVGLLRRPLDADALLALAQRHSGLQRFWRHVIHRAAAPAAGLPAREEASLSLVGRMATRWDVVRFLTNLLQFQDAETRDPGILRRADRAADLHHRPAAQWHHLPAPAAAGGPGQPRAARLADDLPLSAPARGRDRRPARVARQLRAFERLAPGVPRAASAGRHLAAGMQRDHRACVPQPALRHDLPHPELPALAGPGRPPAGLSVPPALPPASAASGARAERWVVKCPDHLFALDAIRAVYPDARLVFVHRDPVKVLLSVAKLTEVLRRPFTRQLDPQRDRPRRKARRWLEGTQRMIAAGDDAGLPEPIHHVHHTALVAIRSARSRRSIGISA